MPRNRQRRRGGRSGGRGGGLVAARGSPGYEQVIKVSGNVAISPSTGGSTFYGVRGFTNGTGAAITPYTYGTNYATLSQWGDLRLGKIRLTFLCQVGSAGDPLQVVTALDSTGADLAGSGSATGAFNTILSRQTAKLTIVCPAQFRPQRVVYRPVELQNRLWHPQSDLSASSLAIADDWGVLVSAVCPAASVTISMIIEWFFNVREPTLSGVLLGVEDDQVRARLEHQSRVSFPTSVSRHEQSVAPAAGVILTNQMAASLGTTCRPTVGELVERLDQLTKLVMQYAASQ